MEVNKVVDIGGVLRPMPMERYTFGWSDWRSLYPVERPALPSQDGVSIRSVDLIDRFVDVVVATGEWIADQLLRVVP